MAWCVVLALLLLASVAHAQDTNSLILHAYHLQRQNNFAEALAEYRQAYEISPEPRLLVMIAQNEAALGRWDAAFDDLNRALGNENDPWITRRQQELTRVLIEEYGAHIALFWVRGSPAGAEVRVNGRLVGSLPMDHNIRTTPDTPVTIEVRAEGYLPEQQTLQFAGGEPHDFNVNLRPNGSQTSIALDPPDAEVRVDGIRRTGQGNTYHLGPGSHVLVVDASGYRTYRREFVVRENEPTRVRVVLVPTSQPFSTSGRTPLRNMSDQDYTSTVHPIATSSERGNGVSPWVWVGAGVAVAGVALATTLWVSGNSIERDYNERCRAGGPPPRDCADAWRQDQSDLNSRATGIYISWGAAAVGAAVTGIALLTGGPSEESARAVAHSRPRWRAGLTYSALEVSW